MLVLQQIATEQVEEAVEMNMANVFEFTQGNFWLSMPIYLRNYAMCMDQKFDSTYVELEQVVSEFLLLSRM
jgi:hypothetical protein